jgi:hypothetical protein
LRPTLRAAIALESRYGFPKLIRGIAEGSYSILSAIIRECASTKDDGNTILSLRPIGTLIAALQAPCHALVLALAGHDESKPATAGTGKAIPFSEHYRDLFRIATGSIGWTPAEAYAASPAEIIEAYKGRADLLASIFGGGPEKPSAAPVDPATINHSAGIARLRELFGAGRSAAS